MLLTKKENSRKNKATFYSPLLSVKNKKKKREKRSSMLMNKPPCLVEKALSLSLEESITVVK